MGANCCIAAKESSQRCMAPTEVSTFRVRHSPSWSFRWDNRTHIEDIMENSTALSNQSSGNIRPEVKNSFIAPTDGNNSEDSCSDVLRRVKWQKSDKNMEASKFSKVDRPAHRATSAGPLLEAKSSRSPGIVTVASDIKTAMSLPSTRPPVPQAHSEDPSSSMSHSICIDPNLTRESPRSHGHQLYRQISEVSIPSLKPLSGNSSTEWSSNSKLAACSNDIFAGQLQSETSDGWSTRTPSDLVATSQRDRWSIDHEPLGSVASKTSRSNGSHPSAPSPDQEVCKLCLRLLKERSSWNSHELAVVAVLFCGHAYHANCLDIIVAESEKYDPPCPVCTNGEACTAKLFEKMELKVKNKTSRNMADTNLDWSCKHQKKAKREPRFATSSSMKDTFSRPFLRRHFSTGSRPPTPISGSEPTRKKSLWSRHWRE